MWEIIYKFEFVIIVVWESCYHQTTGTAHYSDQYLRISDLFLTQNSPPSTARVGAKFVWSAPRPPGPPLDCRLGAFRARFSPDIILS